METSPKISIVMPLYNSEKFIKSAIESVLLQSFRDFELILVDDCSTDSTLEIVSKYDDPRIKIFHQKQNSGESSSRNLGIEVANGKYIYFMDHDDMILPETLEIFINAAEESQAEVVYMNSWLNAKGEIVPQNSDVKVEKNLFRNPVPRFLSKDPLERLNVEEFGDRMYCTPWIKIQRRDFLMKNQIYFPETILNGDVLFQIAELALGNHMQVIEGCCYVHRLHQDCTMYASAEIHLRKATLSMSPALKYIREVISKADISEQMRIAIEIRIISLYVVTYILRSYRGELSLEKIDSILREITDSDLTRVLIHAFASQL